MKKFLIVALLVLIVVPSAWAKQDSLLVRVAIIRDAREADLSIDGAYMFRDSVTGKMMVEGQHLVKSKIRLLERGMLVGLNVYPSKRIIIEPLKDAAIVINNFRFRGNITLIRTPSNRLTVVNSINIEDYVKGVLYHEVSHHWPMEALKAQAVATRTYALSSRTLATKDYDITNDIYSQVYGGKQSERYRTGLAVERTKGQILVYQGKIFPAYFHADCGGMTEDAQELWHMDLAPLKGVPCTFCKDSPHMHWKRNMRLKDIQDALNVRGQNINGTIKDIAVVERDRSGRIKNLKITTREGQEVVVKADDFRNSIGPNELKSNNYEIAMQGYFVDFTGKGWGHGVGMCQWGALGMAKQQFTYTQILNYYYPHAQLVDDHEFLK